MKPLFFTSTRPKHQYKTEKFFSGYLRTRKVSRFVSGSSKQFSNYKKMLMMKKFFMWYYNIKSWRLFFKVFQISFLQKRYTFRYLLSLYHLLERNLLVLLVRTKFSFNLIESLYYLKNHFIYVNGYPVTLAFATTKVGDIIEVFTWQFKYFINYFPILLATRKASLFYYKYYNPLKHQYFIAKAFVPTAQRFAQARLATKYYYNYLFFKIGLFKKERLCNSVKGLTSSPFRSDKLTYEYVTHNEIGLKVAFKYNEGLKVVQREVRKMLWIRRIVFIGKKKKKRVVLVDITQLQRMLSKLMYFKILQKKRSLNFVTTKYLVQPSSKTQRMSSIIMANLLLLQPLWTQIKEIKKQKKIKSLVNKGLNAFQSSTPTFTNTSKYRIREKYAFKQ